MSEAPKAAVAPKKFPSYNPDIKSDEQKKEEVSDFSTCHLFSVSHLFFFLLLAAVSND